MAQDLSPGSNVTQKRSTPVVAAAIATAIGGFMVYCSKGPVGVPIEVVGTDDAAQVFGQRPFGYALPGVSRLDDTLIDFFAEGGQSCYVMRYVGVGAVTAARTLYTGGLTYGAIRSSPGSFPATALAAGSTFLGKVNGGSTLTATIHATAATLDGVAATYAAVTPGHTLTVFVNGVLGNQVITFNGTEATEAEFRTQINSQLRGAQCADDGSGELKITTTVMGSSAGGAIVSGSADVLVSLGYAVGSFTNAGPNNVANVASVQASELVALFNSTFTGSTTVANGDNSITWQTNTLGSSGSVQFTSGTGVPEIPGFSDETVTGANTIPLAGIAVTAAMGIYSSPGSWANAWGVQASQQNQFVTSPAPTAAGSTSTLVVASSARLAIGDTFSITNSVSTVRGIISGINGNILALVAPITVPSGGYAGTEQVILETFTVQVTDQNGNVVFPSPWSNLRMSSLSSNYYVNVINNSVRTPINVTDLASGASDPRPSTDLAPVNMSGGADGAAPVANDVISQLTSNAWNQALDVNMISIPGVATDYPGVNGVSILTNLAAYLILRADTMGVMEEPQGIPTLGAGGPRDWIQNTANISTSEMAVYWPWVKRLDVSSGALTSYPPSPHVQGIVARVQNAGNFGSVPAGVEDAQLLNIVDLDNIVMEQGPEYNDAYPAGVNFILKFPGQGFALFGSRTLDTSGDGFGQINVQYVFNIAKRIIKPTTRFVNFAFNTPSTRQAVVRVLTATFREWRKAEILAGATDAEAFFIICDDTNNTPSVIASGKLKCRIGLAVNVPIEFQDYTLELDTRAITQSTSQQAATGSSAST